MLCCIHYTYFFFEVKTADLLPRADESSILAIPSFLDLLHHRRTSEGTTTKSILFTAAAPCVDYTIDLRKPKQNENTGFWYYLLCTI